MKTRPDMRLSAAVLSEVHQGERVAPASVLTVGEVHAVKQYQVGEEVGEKEARLVGKRRFPKLSLDRRLIRCVTMAEKVEGVVGDNRRQEWVSGWVLAFPTRPSSSSTWRGERPSKTFLWVITGSNYFFPFFFDPKHKIFTSCISHLAKKV